MRRYEFLQNLFINKNVCQSNYDLSKTKNSKQIICLHMK